MSRTRQGASGLDQLLAELNNSHQVNAVPVEICQEYLGANYTEILESNEVLNLECLKHAPSLTKAAIIKGSALLVMTILSLIGNITIMHNIRQYQTRRAGHIYTLLFHLAIADIFVTIWCIFGDAIWYFTVEWKAGNLECKVFKFAQMVSLYISTFIMVLIGVDRFIAVRYPLRSISRGMCLRLVMSCWLLSGFLSLPQILVFNVLLGPFQEPFYQCVTYGSYASDWQEQLYTLFTLAFTFIIPLSILATTYLLTVRTLHRDQNFFGGGRRFSLPADPRRQKIIQKAKMRSFKISVCIVVAFVVCWTPYYVAMIYTFINRADGQEMKDPDSLVFSVVFFFGVSNTIANPILYNYFHGWKPSIKCNGLKRTKLCKRKFYSNLSQCIPDQRTNALVNETELVIRFHEFHPGPKFVCTTQVSLHSGDNFLHWNSVHSTATIRENTAV